MNGTRGDHQPAHQVDDWSEVEALIVHLDLHDPEALDSLTDLRASLDQIEATLVHRARAAAASWSDIALMLDVSKSRAHQRWAHLDDVELPD